MTIVGQVSKNHTSMAGAVRPHTGMLAADLIGFDPYSSHPAAAAMHNSIDDDQQARNNMGTTTNQMGIGFHVCNVAGVTQGIYMSSYTAVMARNQIGCGTELFMSGKTRRRYACLWGWGWGFR